MEEGRRNRNRDSRWLPATQAGRKRTPATQAEKTRKAFRWWAAGLMACVCLGRKVVCSKTTPQLAALPLQVGHCMNTKLHLYGRQVVEGGICHARQARRQSSTCCSCLLTQNSRQL